MFEYESVIMDIPKIWSCSDEKGFEIFCKNLILLDIIKQFGSIYVKTINWNVLFGIYSIKYKATLCKTKKPNLLIIQDSTIPVVSYHSPNIIAPYDKTITFEKKQNVKSGRKCKTINK